MKPTSKPLSKEFQTEDGEASESLQSLRELLESKMAEMVELEAACAVGAVAVLFDGQPGDDTAAPEGAASAEEGDTNGQFANPLDGDLFDKDDDGVNDVTAPPEDEPPDTEPTMSEQWRVLRPESVRKTANARAHKMWALTAGNVLEIDLSQGTKMDKAGVERVFVSLVEGHPGNAKRTLRFCLAGWIRLTDETGSILDQLAMADAWVPPPPVVIPVALGDLKEHPKYLGHSDSFKNMMEAEQRETDVEWHAVESRLAEMRKHPDADHHEPSQEELDLMERELELKTKDSRLKELDHLETTAHAADLWDEDGVHEQRVLYDDPAGPAAEPQRVGNRAPMPVLVENKHTYTIKQAEKGVYHKSHYKLRVASNQMRIEDTILHDYKHGQLARRRRKAEDAFLAAVAQYDAAKKMNPGVGTADGPVRAAWDTMGMVESHLERMNKLADGIPRPEDAVQEVSLDLFLREVEAYDSIQAPPEEDTTYEAWVRKKNEQRKYKGFHIGAQISSSSTSSVLSLVFTRWRLTC